jgi:hypothetical protein
LPSSTQQCIHLAIFLATLKDLHLRTNRVGRNLGTWDHHPTRLSSPKFAPKVGQSKHPFCSWKLIHHIPTRGIETITTQVFCILENCPKSRTFLNTKFCDENPLMNYYYYFYFYLLQLQLLLVVLLQNLVYLLGKRKLDLIIIDIWWWLVSPFLGYLK